MDKSYPGAVAQGERATGLGRVVEGAGKAAASVAHEIPFGGRMVGRAIENAVEGVGGKISEASREEAVRSRLVDRAGNKMRGAVGDLSREREERNPRSEFNANKSIAGQRQLSPEQQDIINRLGGGPPLGARVPGQRGALGDLSQRDAVQHAQRAGDEEGSNLHRYTVPNAGGSMNVVERPELGVRQVQTVAMKDKGQGWGTRTLQRAADDAHDAGQVLHSDKRVSEGQVGAYKNLAQLGYDVKLQPHDKLQGEYKAVGDHVFEVRPPKGKPLGAKVPGQRGSVGVMNPETASGDEVVQHVMRTHYPEEKTLATKDPKQRERDVRELLGPDANGPYKKVDYPLDRIHNDTPISSGIIKRYAERDTPYPAIVMDKNGGVRDGNHRIEAARMRGDETIPAYVPQGHKVPGQRPLGAKVPGQRGAIGDLSQRVTDEKEAKALGVEPGSPISAVHRGESGPQSIKSLSQAIDSAIAEHTALDPTAQKANVKAARQEMEKYGVKELLSKNAKMMKSETGIEGGKPIELPDGRGVETTGLALAPAYEEKGFTTCPNSASCKESCLGKTSGGNFMFGGGSDLSALKGPRLAHFNNTMAMLGSPKEFAIKLNDEITKAEQKAKENGNKLGVRLNVLSDLHPRVHQAIIKAHPDVDFYDYTKNASNPIAPNHHYTYSSTGVSQPAGLNGLSVGVSNPHQNWSRVRGRLDDGQNVAMSFSVKGKAGDAKLPKFVHDQETGKTYQVIDGDTHDFRPLDKQPEGQPGVVIGLRNKAGTTKQTTAAAQSKGFFVHHDPSVSDTVHIAPQPKSGPAFNNNRTVEQK